MAEAAMIKVLANEHSRKHQGRGFGPRGYLEDYPENFRIYLRAKTNDEAKSFLHACCLMHLGMQEQKKFLTAKLRNEEDQQYISPLYVFDLADQTYDEKVKKYANDNLSLDGSMKEQKRNPNFNSLTEFIQVQLSECMSLKMENIQLTEEITTKQGKPAGIAVKNWLSLPTEFIDKLQNGTEDEKKRLAIEYFEKHKELEELHATIKEEKREMSKYKTETANEILQLKQQANVLYTSCQNQKKQIEDIVKDKDKLKADTEKQLKDSKSKLDKMTKDRDQCRKSKEDFERHASLVKSKLDQMTVQNVDLKRLNDKFLKQTKELQKENELLLTKNFEIQRNRAEMTETLKNYEDANTQLRHNHQQVYQQALYYEDQLKRMKTHALHLEHEQRKLQEQLTSMARAKDNALNRLSKMAGDKLIQGNAGITDLSDPDRPTKLAEQFSELYDNQWSDSFEELEGKMPEDDAVKFLISVVIEAFRFCCRVIQGQKDALTSALCELPSTDMTVSNTVISTKSIDLDVSDNIKQELEKLRLQVIRKIGPNAQKKHFHVVVTHMLQKMLHKEAGNVKYTVEKGEKASASVSAVVTDNVTPKSSDNRHYQDVDMVMQKDDTGNGSDNDGTATEMNTFREEDDNDDSISDLETETTTETTSHKVTGNGTTKSTDFNRAMYNKPETNRTIDSSIYGQDVEMRDMQSEQGKTVKNFGQFDSKTLNQDLRNKDGKGESAEDKCYAQNKLLQENQESDGHTFSVEPSTAKDKEEGVEDALIEPNVISQDYQDKSDGQALNLEPSIPKDKEEGAEDTSVEPNVISQDNQVEPGGQTFNLEPSITKDKEEGMVDTPNVISQDNQVESDSQTLHLKLSIGNDQDNMPLLQNYISQEDRGEPDGRILNPDLKKILEILKGHDKSIQNERKLLTKSCCIFPSKMKADYKVENLTKSLSVLDRMTNENEIVKTFLSTLKPKETKAETHLENIEENCEQTYPMLFGFANACVELCWKMRLQDPEVHMDEGEDDKGAFKHDKYKEYTRSGDQMDYIVWPALYLYKGGPMLGKGVAQPKVKKSRNS